MSYPKNINIKNVRLHVPIDLYNRIKKEQARRVLADLPEKTLANVCIDLLYQATAEVEANKEDGEVNEESKAA